MAHDDSIAAEAPAALHPRLDRMLARGRITPEEANRVRDAKDQAEQHAALTAIRTRHARDRVAAAMAEGRIQADEADEVLQRLAEGEDPKAVRRLLHGMTAGRDRR